MKDFQIEIDELVTYRRTFCFNQVPVIKTIERPCQLTGCSRQCTNQIVEHNLKENTRLCRICQRRQFPDSSFSKPMYPVKKLNTFDNCDHHE